MSLIIVEYSPDGVSWSQMGEWPADRSDELWRELEGWIDRNRVPGSIRRRPMTDRDTLLGASYPRLSRTHHEEVIRRVSGPEDVG